MSACFAIDQILSSPDFQHITSQSASARQANEFLFGFVKNVIAGRRLKHVVEIGCNDTFLLQMLESVSDRLFGLDPILAGKEKEFLGSVSEASRHKYGIIGKFIENVDFKSEIGGSPDLVVSNFVFEHIKSPRLVLEKAFQRSPTTPYSSSRFPAASLSSTMPDSTSCRISTISSSRWSPIIPC